MLRHLLSSKIGGLQSVSLMQYSLVAPETLEISKQGKRSSRETWKHKLSRKCFVLLHKRWCFPSARRVMRSVPAADRRLGSNAVVWLKVPFPHQVVKPSPKILAIRVSAPTPSSCGEYVPLTSTRVVTAPVIPSIAATTNWMAIRWSRLTLQNMVLDTMPSKCHFMSSIHIHALLPSPSSYYSLIRILGTLLNYPFSLSVTKRLLHSPIQIKRDDFPECCMDERYNNFISVQELSNLVTSL